jgi:hypothetical protein
VLICVSDCALSTVLGFVQIDVYFMHTDPCLELCTERWAELCTTQCVDYALSTVLGFVLSDAHTGTYWYQALRHALSYALSDGLSYVLRSALIVH